MEIRKPDHEEIQKILTYSPEALHEGTMGRADFSLEQAKELSESLLKKGSYYLMAMENEELAGWVLLSKSFDLFKEEEIGFITELYVLPNYRRRGVAKKLIKKGIDEMKIRGFSDIRLNVFSGNDAIELYKELGFKERSITMELCLTDMRS
ncbi:GNAT family N-acetyltransferase [Bacillus mangrovi]|uniref:GNAT family N-acetyltransferase n=1 Tax=Metabacillus mangrovi TaxID=1491830 RepID=A0A7X2V5P2_9BACI|nr:GNAT family N-acetyltransferase [Metabacillus mangrovi]MTH55017.1 GNAT family N-acetyltransferase [Metabacillus mangrovi]